LPAASKRNLEAEVAADRLSRGFILPPQRNHVLPSPRERTEDILASANCVMRQVSIAANSSGLSISSEAADVLLRYHWPGNLRELHNALGHAATPTRTPTIMIADLPDTVRNSDSGTSPTSARRTLLKDFEREHILRVMAQTSALGQAAATLGINVTTLWRKRRHYGIA
jgi:transcriptional regulator with PAS, ATPase and Fis domain